MSLGEPSFQDKIGVFWLKAVLEFDEDVNMQLDKYEFCQLYRKLASMAEQGVLSPSNRKACLIFDEVDKNSDGEMTEAEFTDWAELNQERANEFLQVLDEKDFEAAAGRSAGSPTGCCSECSNG